MEKTIQVPPLASLGRVVLEEAKRFRRSSMVMQRWILGVAITAVLVQAGPSILSGSTPLWSSATSKAVTYVCAIIATILQGARWWLARCAIERHLLGSTIKRRALLIDSLGPTAEQLDLRMLRDLAGEEAAMTALSLPLPTAYYASRLEPGLVRLRENLQESAFFSHSLYRKSARHGFIVFGLTTACMLIGLFLVLAFAPKDTAAIIANCAIAFISFLIATDRLGRAMSWHEAANVVERIERRLESINLGTTEQLMAAFADYETVTTGTPAVPTSLYDRECARLDKLWQDRTGQ